MYNRSVIFGLSKNQSGQALLIVVLVMVVALTVGLSVASRSISNLRTTQDQASSQKALSAAESGVEQALKTQNKTVIAGGFNDTANTNFSTSISSISGSTNFLVHGNNNQINEIVKGNPVYIWTTNYSSGNPWANPWHGTLTIYWGDSINTCSTPAEAAVDPALEVTVISGARANPTLQKYVYDPCANRTSPTGFTNSSGVAFARPATAFGLAYQITLPAYTAANPIYLISVNALYSNTRIGANIGVADSPLPYQGADINSTGTADNQVQRRVVVFQGYPQIPAGYFPYTIFSP